MMRCTKFTGLPALGLVGLLLVCMSRQHHLSTSTHTQAETPVAVMAPGGCAGATANRHCRYEGGEQQSKRWQDLGPTPTRWAFMLEVRPTCSHAAHKHSHMPLEALGFMGVCRGVQNRTRCTRRAAGSACMQVMMQLMQRMHLGAAAHEEYNNRHQHAQS